MLEYESESMEMDDSDQTMSLLDLAWEDIVFEYMLPMLSIKDLFRLRSVSRKAFNMVTSYFSTVKHIDFSPFSKSFTKIAFQIVTESCRNLRSLIIVESSGIDDDILTSVFQANKFLIHVDLSCCTKLNGSSLCTLAANCNELKVLRLRECTWITREIIEVLTSMTKLQQIDFSSCAALNNSHISAFIDTCPDLTTLHMAFCKCVDDTTLSIIARHGQNITLLDIRACMGVTDNGIRLLSEYCTTLKSLFILNCHLVTEYSLKLLRCRKTVSIDRESTAILPMPFILIPRLQV